MVNCHEALRGHNTGTPYYDCCFLILGKFSNTPIRL